MFDLEQTCDIVTTNPDRCTGPMRLRLAVRSIMLHRPLADAVEVRLGDGQRLSEIEIEALHLLATLPS